MTIRVPRGGPAGRCYTLMRSPVGELVVTGRLGPGDGAGGWRHAGATLTGVGFTAGGAWRGFTGGDGWVDGAGPLSPATDQLAAFLAGERRAFDLQVELAGTAFQRHVWAAVAAIPYGETATYRDIAAAIGRPAASRAVGAANGANPLALVIPCHRVVGTDRGLTGYAGGLDAKRLLLALERRAAGA